MRDSAGTAHGMMRIRYATVIEGTAMGTMTRVLTRLSTIGIASVLALAVGAASASETAAQVIGKI
jgi:hypothetical protein